MATPRRRLTPAEVRFIRQQLGYTQSKVAEVIGVARLSINRWENEPGIITPSHSNHLRLLARVRGVGMTPREEQAATS